MLKEIDQAGTFPLRSYAYVSLFGLNSLSSLRQAVFSNTVGKGDISSDPTLDTLGRFLDAPSQAGSLLFKKIVDDKAGTVWGIGRKIAHIGSNVGVINRFLGDATSALFLMVRDRVICFDDLERRGKGLDLQDILGLASMLKEQRRCKVVLLLNDQALGDDEELFRRNLEKVVDIFFRFVPVAAESAEIAFPDATPTMAKAAAFCLKLDLTNIRILERIKRFIEDITPGMKQLDPSILDQAIGTIVLLCWVVYDPASAPSVAYLKGRDILAYHDEGRRESMSAEELKWEEVLQTYEFGSLDELDQALLHGIQNGIFDAAQIAGITYDLNLSAIGRQKQLAFRDAWRPLHDTFDDNQDAVLDGLYRSFFENFEHISPTNLNGTVELFKELGRGKEAAEMLDHYVHNRTDPGIFDIRGNIFGGEIRDPDVVEAFNARHSFLTTRLKPRDALKDLAERKVFSPDGIAAVSTLSSADLCALFRRLRGAERDRIIEWCVRAGRVTGLDPETIQSLRVIGVAARQALEEIAAESPINRRRVSRFLELGPGSSPKSVADTADEAPR